MNTRHPLFAALVASGMLVLGATDAFGQASAPLAVPDLPASTASAPAAPTGPRMRSAAETGNRATAPGDLRPERPVTPQISIPFGKKPAPPTQREERLVQRGHAASSGGIDDAAARCESQTDPQVRAACRARLASEAKGRLPN